MENKQLQIEISKELDHQRKSRALEGIRTAVDTLAHQERTLTPNEIDYLELARTIISYIDRNIPPGIPLNQFIQDRITIR